MNPPENTGSPARTAVHVAEDGPRFGQIIRIGKHLLRADEPVERGGADSAARPHDLLLAALGACTTITVRMYAERKGWPLEHVAVSLHDRKVDAPECPGAAPGAGPVTCIEMRVELRGPLSAEQRSRLTEIADRCPVHRLLTGQVVINTEPAA